jgi:hypothetical protein
VKVEGNESLLVGIFMGNEKAWGILQLEPNKGIAGHEK